MEAGEESPEPLVQGVVMPSSPSRCRSCVVGPADNAGLVVGDPLARAAPPCLCSLLGIPVALLVPLPLRVSSRYVPSTFHDIEGPVPSRHDHPGVRLW